MSLPHILDTARKLGIPVIITNDRGESPQVVMPFEDFASMVGVTTSAMKRPRMSKSDEEDEDDEIAQALADLAKEEVERASKEEKTNEPLRMEEKDEFVEERFYFEPLEEEK